MATSQAGSRSVVTERGQGSDWGGTASVIVFRPIVAELERRGIEPTPMLAAVGLRRDDLGDPERRVPEALLIRAWNMAAEASHDEFFGLGVAEHTRVGTYDVLDYAVCWSASIEDALSRIARFHRLLCDGADVEISKKGDHVVVRRTVPASAITRHECEALLAVIVARLRGVAGFPLKPWSTRFSHRAPPRLKPYRAIFGAEPKFGCRTNELVFMAEDLQRPASSVDPGLTAVLDRYAGEMLARLPPLGDLVSRLRAAVGRSLASGMVSLEVMATRLHTSPRTLQRELSLLGTTYRKLLEEVRREMAMTLLEDHTSSITEVAFLLGFASTASFHRVFKRWSGRTPEQFRAAGGRPLRQR